MVLRLPLVLVFLVFGCVFSSKQTEKKYLHLNGSYSGPCKVKKGDLSSRVIWSFSPDMGFAQSKVDYIGKTCRVPLFSESVRGIYSLEKDTQPTGILRSRLKRVREVWAAWHENSQKQFELGELCGVKDWSDRVDVTGRICKGKKVQPAGLFVDGLLKLEDGKLYFGGVNKKTGKLVLDKSKPYEKVTEWLQS